MTKTSELKIDFFLAGFPKCGTTSLATYLSAHPNICFSSIKEPFFFCTDFPRRQVINTWNEYQRLFQKNEKTSILGEGTVIYVYSEVALASIAKHNPLAKLIFIVRNPIDIVCSLHSNQLRVLDENVGCMETAWSLQQRRQLGECIPRSCREAFFLQYKEVASQGKYLKQVFDKFPKEQILVLFFDDLKNDPESTYNQTLGFLGMPYCMMSEFGTHNVNMAFKRGLSGSVGKGLLNLTRSQTLIRLKRRLNVRDLGIENQIRRFFMRKEKRTPLSPAFREYLANEFENDIRMLGVLTSRDLTGWLQRP